MNRTLMVARVLAVVALTLLIVACGSDPTPTPVPAATTPVAPANETSATEAPTAEPTALPTPIPASPAPTVDPTSEPTAAPTAVAPAPEPTPGAPEEADPTDAYFAMGRVLEVSIEIAEEDWDTLRHQTRTFEDLMAEIEEYNLSRPFADIYTWFSATVTIDGETHTEVGVRKKGFLGSQSDTKPSLKLRFDKYVDGQALGGVMERMTLNNSIQDPSMVNTCLTYQVFAATGSPTPRCNFATVAVNGKELGLYVHVEGIKAPFLERHFDSADGNLYEGTVSDFTPSHRGTIEKKTNEDEDDWSDVDAVMTVLQDPSEAAVEGLGELVDLDRFLSFWATEVLVGHWDGYAGDRNNYLFYREPDGRFVFIPWGVDDTFHLKDDPNPFDDISNPPPSVLALSAIPNRLYNHPEWRAKYAERLKEILDAVWDEDVLLANVDDMAAIVQEHALPEARAMAASDTERVRKFILKRKGEILADITPEPPDWPEPDYGAAAADGIESFEIRFETTWESNRSANPLAEGTVYELNEDAEWVVTTEGDTGATAGPASPQEEADIGVQDAALFTVMGLYPDGAIRGVTFWMPVDRVAAGVELSIGVDANVGGAIWTIPAGRLEPEGFIPVTAGGIEFTEAGTEPGAAIAGILYASFGDDTVPGEEGDGTVATVQPGGGEPEDFELRFETTWGSNTSANPFEEGTLTYAGEGPDDTPGMVAVIAGVASPEEQALLPGVPDTASVSIFGLGEDGSIAGVTIVLPQKELTSRAALVFGEDVIAGGVWEIPPGASAPDWFIPLDSGRLELTEAGTEPGAAISGRLFGSFSEPDLPTSAVTAIPETADIGLVINEVAAKGEPIDWFELYNASDSHIALANFVVADDLEDAGKRVAFPSDLVVAPGGFLKVEVDSDNWAGFKLGGDEELGVWTSGGALVDGVDWNEGDSGEGESFARVPDGSGKFQTVASPTPGAVNQGGR